MTLGTNNDQVVTFNYLIAQGEYRISTLLAALFGGLCTWLDCKWCFYLRARLSLGRAKRKIKRLESVQTKQENQESRPTVASATK